MSSKPPSDAQLERMIAGYEYHLFEGTKTVGCAMKLINGFTILGQASCAGEFDPQLGMQFSHEDAIKRLSEYVAFARCELSGLASIRSILQENENGN